MARLCSIPVLLLVLVLAVGACKQDEQATATMAEVTEFTDELVSTVTEAADRKAGVAEAQALLEERREVLSAKLTQLDALLGVELSEEAQNAIIAARSDNLAKLAKLEDDLIAEIFEDEQLEVALEKLIDDHEALIRSK